MPITTIDGMMLKEMFLSGALLSAIPGILLQLILLPVIVIAMEKFIDR